MSTCRHPEYGIVVPCPCDDSCECSRVCNAHDGAKRVFTPPPAPRSPYKDSVQLSVECEGKAGDVIEKRLTTDRACKPSKTMVIESDPGAVRVTLRLASTGQNALPCGGYVPAAYFESNPLGSGTSLPTLYIDEEYVFSFKFERDARVKICFFGFPCREPRLTIAEGRAR